MHRSEITVDLGALRRNVRTLLREVGGAELWAVVKANGYGHGAVDVAGAALGSGASALCVATVQEGLALRSEYSGVRILVMGPVASSRDIAHARDADLELAVADDEIPEDVRVHVSRASTPSVAVSRSTASRRSQVTRPTTGSSRFSRGRATSRT